MKITLDKCNPQYFPIVSCYAAKFDNLLLIDIGSHDEVH